MTRNVEDRPSAITLMNQGPYFKKGDIVMMNGRSFKILSANCLEVLDARKASKFEVVLGWIKWRWRCLRVDVFIWSEILIRKAKSIMDFK